MNVEEKTLEFIRDYAPKSDRIGRYVFQHRLMELMFQSVPDVELPDVSNAGRATTLSGQNPPAGGCAANVLAAKEGKPS